MWPPVIFCYVSAETETFGSGWILHNSSMKLHTRQAYTGMCTPLHGCQSATQQNATCWYCAYQTRNVFAVLILMPKSYELKKIHMVTPWLLFYEHREFVSQNHPSAPSRYKNLLKSYLQDTHVFPVDRQHHVLWSYPETAVLDSFVPCFYKHILVLS